MDSMWKTEFVKLYEIHVNFQKNLDKEYKLFKKRKINLFRGRCKRYKEF